MELNLRQGYAIFVNTICQGSIPNVHDEGNCVRIFDTEIEAQREIADYQMTRLQEFLDGDREFDDAMTVDEYIVPVTVYAGGQIVDDLGRTFVSSTRI